MEGVFEHVKGVEAVTAGYAGGTRGTANYEAVSSERTNHAESIRIVYDPSVVSYGRLLEIYFAVAHDPTQIDGQYPDQGRSYRSAIFPQSAAQRQIAAAYIASLDRAHVFARPVATRLETGNFYPAEEYHQQFMRRNPGHPYIQQWDVARVERLQTRFPEFYRPS
jgi:peptide-methionine (S)-S-oxide reductase